MDPLAWSLGVATGGDPAGAGYYIAMLLAIILLFWWTQ